MDASTDNLTPSAISKKTFGSRLRGVDPTEVTAFLERVAGQLETAETDRDAWQAEVARLRDEVVSLQESLREQQAEPDEAALTEQLGQEAGRVLTEARAAAADRLAEAEAEAADIIAAAEELHAERSRAADAEAERIRSEAVDEERRRLESADDEAGTIRDKARQDAEDIRTGAGVDQQAADAEAARIIREAELTRRRILEDLARRRSAARRQIEQLRAGRERLLASHEVVRRALEEISEELNISMSEARAAAETAGHNVSDSTLEEIEAEIETAKLAGLLDTGPVPVVTSARNRSDGEPTVEMAPVQSSTAPAAVDEGAGAEDVAEVVDEAGSADVESSSEADATASDEADASERETSETAATVEVEDVVEVDDAGDTEPQPDITASADAATGDEGDGPLAEVVSLTAARQDVDTDRHPANRRPQSTMEPELESEPDVEVESQTELDVAAETEPEPMNEAEPVEVAAALVSVPEPDDVGTDESEDAAVSDDAVEVENAAENEPADPAAELDDAEDADTANDSEEPTRVDSLFARMRQTQDAAVLAGTTEAESAEETPDDPSDPQRLADEVGRKMKRVLADEQSDVLSTLRAGADEATLVGLLGSEDEHRQRYWAVTEAVLSDHEVVAPDAESEVGRMVDGIRRRVDGCLTDLSDDPDAVVDRLRSVYREVKTQRIAEHAQLICGALEDLTAS